MLVAFEGPDGSGKSTLSVLFEQYLNQAFRSSDGTLKLDPHLGDFIWTKEPTFTTEEADLLNSSGCDDEFKRERLFFESRIRHQDIISGKNVICDRYLWSGITYAYVSSPACYDLLRELYLSEDLFIQPDLYIFVDTPIEVCFDRKPSVGLDRLRELRTAYTATRRYIRAPVLTVQAMGSEEYSMNNLRTKFEDYVAMNNLSADVAGW